MHHHQWAAVAAGAIVGLAGVAPAAVTGVDLSKYVRVGRYDLPEPTRTPAPASSELAREASAVTYCRDTGTLFVVGDGSTSVVQVSKTGQLINSMTLARDATKPRGTYFDDVEALAYVGNGQFVLGEERLRQVSKFTYVPNTTLNASGVQAVKLATTVGNSGLEGLTWDTTAGGYGFVAVNENAPQGLFQTTVNFAAGTATNGSATTATPANLFDPAKLGLGDLADVYALSNLPSLAGGGAYNNLLVLSQESGRLVQCDRAGNVLSTLTIARDAADTLSVADLQFEGVTMDDNGLLYLTAENGGGNADRPQLWVYAPIPEPASVGLLACGLTALARRRRAGS